MSHPKAASAFHFNSFFPMHSPVISAETPSFHSSPEQETFWADIQTPSSAARPAEAKFRRPSATGTPATVDQPDMRSIPWKPQH
jgi:hypothetical protein